LVAAGPVVSGSTAAAAIAISGVAPLGGFNFVLFGIADSLPCLISGLPRQGSVDAGKVRSCFPTT
jgi:hypothetical protein